MCKYWCACHPCISNQSVTIIVLSIVSLDLSLPCHYERIKTRNHAVLPPAVFLRTCETRERESLRYAILILLLLLSSISAFHPPHDIWRCRQDWKRKSATMEAGLAAVNLAEILQTVRDLKDQVSSLAAQLTERPCHCHKSRRQHSKKKQSTHRAPLSETGSEGTIKW